MFRRCKKNAPRLNSCLGTSGFSQTTQPVIISQNTPTCTIFNPLLPRFLHKAWDGRWPAPATRKDHLLVAGWFALWGPSHTPSTSQLGGIAQSINQGCVMRGRSIILAGVVGGFRALISDRRHAESGDIVKSSTFCPPSCQGWICSQVPYLARIAGATHNA